MPEFNETYGQTPESLNKPAIQVVEVSRQQFDERKQLVDAPRIVLDYVANRDSYQIADEGTDIVNEGAGPCSILYVIDKETGMALSWHISTISSKEEDKWTKRLIERGVNAQIPQQPESNVFTDPFQEPVEQSNREAQVPQIEQKIVIPTPAQINRYSETQMVEGIDTYRQAMDRIKELVSSSDGQRYEVFQFGQNRIVRTKNNATAAQSIVNNVIEHQDLTYDLTALGIPRTNIHDYRDPTYDGVDSTYYDSDKRKIYRWRR